MCIFGSREEWHIRTTPNDMLGYQDAFTVDVSGLSRQEMAHISAIVQDMKELHAKAE